MRLWNLYNASMEIAARCNAIFSKSFVYQITNGKALLYIDATPIYKFSQAPYDIHMVANKGGNTLEVYLNFHDRLECDEEALTVIAYRMGHDIADRFAIANKNAGFIFFFDEVINYPEYENEYRFCVNGLTKTIKSDYPLANHMKTEFDLEFLLYNKESLENGISDITKDGKHLFDIIEYMEKTNWGIIRIEKQSSDFSVTLQDCNFFSAKLFNPKIMSYISQYAYLEKVPTLEKKPDMNPFVEIYLSGDEREYLVRIERIRNYGLSPKDIQDSLPLVCSKVGVRDDINWAKYIAF